MSRTKIAIVGIVTSAAVFSFWALGRADIITDESSHATRAIGLVDFDFGIEQPTPWQWIDRLPPWWMHLSFHDHPPLVFLLQHYSIKLFGENPTAIRIPSALAGIASVIFLYLIGKQLYGPTVGALSALLFAATVSHVWISRIGLLESVMLAFMLASFWTFLHGLEKPAWWLPLSGAFLGFAVLAKYNALILLPIFLSVAAFHRLILYRFGNAKFGNTYDRIYFRDMRNTKYLILAGIVFLLVISPVIIYNAGLYRNFGHFDFQFSQLFGQNVREWQSRPGQEVLGSYGERLRTYFPRLVETNSPYFLALSAIGLAAILWELIRRRASDRALVFSHSSLVIILAWLIPFLVFIGPAHRFLTLLTPWLALAAGYALTVALRFPSIFTIVKILGIAVLAALETLYAYNSVIALNPIGPQPWAHSYLHRQAGSWGFNELEKYLSTELAGKTPEVAITFEFPFARDLLSHSVERARAEGRRPKPVGIVYNDNINLSSQLWVFLRRIVYDGWPVTSAENFRRGGGQEFFREAGVKNIYFINAADAALQDRSRPPAPDGDILARELEANGRTPKEIKNARGDVAFRVYQFELR